MKPQFDPEDLNNYRPISNLPYLSKLIEHMVASQIVRHLEEHSISEPFQSVYRKFHSTETALTYISNDILCALDKRDSVFVVLLYLSTEFDTVDHKLLLSRLEHRVRLRGKVLDWTNSYYHPDSNMCQLVAPAPIPDHFPVVSHRVWCWG